MCGIFGYVSRDGSGPSVERLRAMARATETRGRHAFGFAWLDGRGRLRAFKQRGRISDHLPLLATMADARMLIGHCRYATQGDPADNVNNHPFACDGGWIVHNGTIPTYAEIADDWLLNPVSDCDSEVLALLIEELDGSLASRCAAAVRAIGESAAVLAGLWKPGRLVLVRRGNPVRVGSTRGGIYFASLADGLPANARPLIDGTVVEWMLQKGKCHVKETGIEDDDRTSPIRAAATRDTERNSSVPADAGPADPLERTRRRIVAAAKRDRDRVGRAAGSAGLLF